MLTIRGKQRIEILGDEVWRSIAKSTSATKTQRCHRQRPENEKGRWLDMRQEKDFVAPLLLVMCVMLLDGMFIKEYPNLGVLVFFIMIFVGTELFSHKN